MQHESIPLTEAHAVELEVPVVDKHKAWLQEDEANRGKGLLSVAVCCGCIMRQHVRAILATTVDYSSNDQ